MQNGTKSSTMLLKMLIFLSISFSQKKRATLLYFSQTSQDDFPSSVKFFFFFSVTALFYLDNSRKIHLWGVRARRPKDMKRRAPHPAGEREKRALAPLFICFSVPGPVLCKLGQPGVLCFTWGSHSGPWTFLCSIFAGFSLLGLLATAILDSFFPILTT